MDMTNATTSSAPTMDVKTAARYLNVSERTLRRLVAGRAIPYHRVANRVRFSEVNLDEYVEQTMVPTKAKV